MSPFDYRGDALHAGEVSLEEIAARTGTPCYVYSALAILERYRAYDQAFGDIPHRVCYAVKANSNLAVLSLLAKAGASFDVVSGGELHRVRKAGGDPGSIVFSGVGKTAVEIADSLAAGIHSFNCESEPELELIDAIAQHSGMQARVSVRANPDVDAATHPYISTGLKEHKFGIDIEEIERLYERASELKGLSLAGVSCHIGSQLLDDGPIMEAVDKMLALTRRLQDRGYPIEHLDLGGGLGIRYQADQQPPAICALIGKIRDRVAGIGLEVMVEPGRSIVGEAGVLLTRVLYRKETARKVFVVVDAAMNDLIRPSLYRSYHEIVPVRKRAGQTITADVVGPVCESGDFLARDREIDSVESGDLLAVCTAGAYGFVLSSNYNSRVRPPEVLVEAGGWRVVRARESYEDLWRGEVD